jgi:hypothetical protein
MEYAKNTSTDFIAVDEPRLVKIKQSDLLSDWLIFGIEMRQTGWIPSAKNLLYSDEKIKKTERILDARKNKDRST